MRGSSSAEARPEQNNQFFNGLINNVALNVAQNRILSLIRDSVPSEPPDRPSLDDLIALSRVYYELSGRFLSMINDLAMQTDHWQTASQAWEGLMTFTQNAVEWFAKIEEDTILPPRVEVSAKVFFSEVRSLLSWLEETAKNAKPKFVQEKLNLTPHMVSKAVEFKKRYFKLVGKYYTFYDWAESANNGE